MAPGKRRLASLALLFASIAFSLLAAEGLVRLVAPQSLIQIRPDIWMPAGRVGWRNRPNADTRINTGEREVRWRTDARGYRTGAQAPAPADINLVALGDSFLAAMQVEDEDTMTRILQEHLAARSGKTVRIWNTGVAGWEPNRYRNELQQILETSKVDGVLVFVFLGNDVGKVVVEDLEPRVPDDRHVLRWPRSLQAGEWVEAIAYPINDFLEVRSHLYVLVRHRLKYLLMRLRLTAYYFPDTMLLSEAASPRWGVTAGILESIAALASARDLRTVFVLIPSSEEADIAEGLATARAFGIPRETFDPDQPHRLLKAEMERRHLVVIDATPALRDAIAAGTPDVYGKVDNHLGKPGHRVVEGAMEEPVWRTFFVSARASR